MSDEGYYIRLSLVLRNSVISFAAFVVCFGGSGAVSTAAVLDELSGIKCCCCCFNRYGEFMLFEFLLV